MGRIDKISQKFPFGNYLKRLRQRKGVSLKEVEKDTGIPNAYLSQLETGSRQRIPSPERMKILSDYYNEPISRLLKEAGYFEEGGIVETKEQKIEKAFQHAKNDPQFKYGTRLKGKCDLDTKLFIIEMYEKITGRKIM